MTEETSETVTVQVSVNLNGSLLEVEERIQEALNEAGCELSEKALEQFDTDGSPIMTGAIKWTRRANLPKTYQSPYGEIVVNRNVYQTSKGGKTYVPLEVDGRMIRSATPRFAKILTSKYAQLDASSVVNDLKENHARTTSRAMLQTVSDYVGTIVQAKEQSWCYETPRVDQAISHITCSLDGAMVRTVDEGWRESMVGAVSLYDCEGERQHTIYFGSAPPRIRKRGFFQAL